MTLNEVTIAGINPALALLPRQMDSPQARVILLAMGLQESRFEHRYQVVQGRPGVRGPARSFWQFEEGGGIKGVMTHAASRYWVNELCKARVCPFERKALHIRIETDDVLAAGLARLLMFTDAKRLPSVSDTQGAWDLYARVWRPGKPHPSTWAGYHKQAQDFVMCQEN